MTVDHTNHHAHEWVVFSTALAEGWLMLQCVECLARATIDDPTEEEWAEAFHAPSRPYRWTDETRVHFRTEPPCPLYVVRTQKNAPVCKCPSRQEPREYDRFPAEIIVPGEKLMDILLFRKNTAEESLQFAKSHGWKFYPSLRHYAASFSTDPVATFEVLQVIPD